jgi:hypothetical protein
MPDDVFAVLSSAFSGAVWKSERYWRFFFVRESLRPSVSGATTTSELRLFLQTIKGFLGSKKPANGICGFPRCDGIFWRRQQDLDDQVSSA